MIITEKEFSKIVRLSDKLNCKLEEGINQKRIQAVWFDKTARTNYRILWLKVNGKTEIEALLSTSFQEDVFMNNKILIVFLDDQDFEYADKFDDFILAHLLCDDNCLYNNKKISLSTYLSESDLKKLLDSYDEKQQILKKISQDFIKEEQQGAWQFMLKAFTNDIIYLELMLFGTSFQSKTLTQRLLILEEFIPEIKKLFVKKDHETYFLIDYITTDDDCGFYDDFGESLQRIQKQLYKLVLQNIKLYTENYNSNTLLCVETNYEVWNHDLMNHKSLEVLKKSDEVEEIFLFHQITSFENEQIIDHLYVFIVLKHKESKTLKTYLQAIEQNPMQHIRITSICYTRDQIQDQVYEYQLFFNKTMKSRNKIYSSGHHPKIHWYNKKISYLDDLDFLVNKNLKLYNRDITPVFENQEAKKYISKESLANFLAKHLQLFIFSEVIFKPSTKNLLTLWNLMIFANGSLLEKFTCNEINQLLQLFQNLQNVIAKEGQLLLDDPTCVLIDKLITTSLKYINVSSEV